jgi:hypothetical protein
LADELMHLEQDLEVFHYCGHARPGALAFTTGDAGAEKLAARLKHCQNLKLAFLNGCQTQAQVRFFHEAGVPYILATSAKIADGQAHWFALQFYKYLTLGHEVAEAFEKAKADADLDGRGLELVLSRGVSGFSGPDLEGEHAPDFDWGLYVREGSPGYRLPMKEEGGSPSDAEISNSKNVVAGATITAGGNVHIGDKQVTQNAEKIYNIDKIDNANFS